MYDCYVVRVEVSLSEWVTDCVFTRRHNIIYISLLSLLGEREGYILYLDMS